MTTDPLPLTATHGLPEISSDVPVPPGDVAPLPRPRDDEPRPFHAARAAPGWLVAYA